MPRQQVIFAAVGDIMLDHEVSRLVERKDPDFPFLNIANELNDVDIFFGNLETPLTKCERRVIWDFSKYGWTGRSRQVFLKGSPRAAISLKNVGFNVVSIANNHILDYGIEGLSDTLCFLRKNGILPVGFGRNTQEAFAPATLEVKGLRFTFFACSWAYEATFFSSGVAPIRSRSLTKQVKKVRGASDIVVVSLHLGKEFDGSPSKPTIRFARSLIEAGADMVLCHHPHVLQGIEAYKHGLIAYSLGNFVFDYQAFSKDKARQDTERARQSIILKCGMSKEGLIDYSVVPIYLNDDFQPTVAPGNSRLNERIMAQVKMLRLRPNLGTKEDHKKVLKVITDFSYCLALNSIRRDFKSLYILSTKIMERLRSGNPLQSY